MQIFSVIFSVVSVFSLLSFANMDLKQMSKEINSEFNEVQNF